MKSIDGYGTTFWEIGQHSPIAAIRAAGKIFTDSGCDIIVSVGGGSPIDAAKAILYYLQQERGGETLLQIAIPTTLSAAEYSVRIKRPTYNRASLNPLYRSELVIQMTTERRYPSAPNTLHLQQLSWMQSLRSTHLKDYGMHNTCNSSNR